MTKPVTVEEPIDDYKRKAYVNPEVAQIIINEISELKRKKTSAEELLDNLATQK